MKNIVRVKDVSLKIKNIEILQNINLEIESGEFIYITGKVGSGKSSLLKMLYHDLKPTSGTIDVAGYNLNKITKKEIPFLRRKLGIIFQDYQLLNDRNVYENLKFVLEAAGITNRKIIRNRISEVLEKVELIDKENNMPYELSGGEQQQAVIARALINNPVLIIADEPTANLDANSSAKIMKILSALIKDDTAVIMTTHNDAILKDYPAKVYTVKKRELNVNTPLN